MIKQSFILLILVIFVSWFLIVWDSPPESFIREKPSEMVSQGQVDSYMLGVTSRRFSDIGNEIFLLTSSKMEILLSSPDVLLTDPRFVSVSDQKNALETAVSFDAERGILKDNGSFLSLSGNVEAIIAGSNIEKTLTSEALDYDSKLKLVTTGEPFTLLSPGVSLSGVGLNADLGKETFKIFSETRALHAF
jgi:LPS export ABC transporter protein LptC